MSNTLRVLLPLLLSSTALSAQDPRISERFPAATAVRINAAIDSAGRDGLPTDPLVLRALEGQAKLASTDQILGAVGRLREALRMARTTLGISSTNGELATAAAALQVGLPATELAEMHRLRPDKPLTAPLGAYLDLVSRGTDPGQAYNRVAEMIRKRAPDADFVRLAPRDVNHDLPAVPAVRTTGSGGAA